MSSKDVAKKVDAASKAIGSKKAKAGVAAPKASGKKKGATTKQSSEEESDDSESEDDSEDDSESEDESEDGSDSEDDSDDDSESEEDAKKKASKPAVSNEGGGCFCRYPNPVCAAVVASSVLSTFDVYFERSCVLEAVSFR